MAVNRSDYCVRTARFAGFGVVALLGLAIAGCGGGSHAPDNSVTPSACPAGPRGLDCLFALWDRVRDDCAPDAVTAFAESIDRRHGDLPACHGGRALFVTRDAPASIGGDMTGWQVGDLVTAPVCSSGLFAVETAIASGRMTYQLIVNGVWKLDPENFAFAYVDDAGNLEGKYSVLNTYDSGVGTLVRPDEALCSEKLGNCRSFTTYLPAGYGSPEHADRKYPVLFMQDGQNIFDDHDCCRSAPRPEPGLHTGWEINRTLDEEISAGRVEPVVVVGVDFSTNRGGEYAGDQREDFIEFQVGHVQPRAAALWRLDPSRVYVAGSSMGAQISLALAFAHPEVYSGAAALSGAFQTLQNTPGSIFEVIERRGKVPVALYLDGGDGTGDRPWDTLRMRDLLVELGWDLADAPDCDPGVDDLCYFFEEGSMHSELNWGARAHLFLGAFFTPSPASP
jgi:predicted alpha/beta superfamily hydrolase